MRNRYSLDGIWNGAYSENCGSPVCFADTSAMSKTEARIPGTFESDLEAAGILPEIYFGANVSEVQKYENMHYCLSRKFAYESSEAHDDILVFEGIDCYADIFIDGKHIGSTENMLIEYRFPISRLTDGEHELFVHIRPASAEARKFKIEPSQSAFTSNWDSLNTRKAPSMYGWDIMPRIVGAGIWKHVYIERIPKFHFTDVFAYAYEASEARARLKIAYNTDIKNANVHRFAVKLIGECGENRFEIDNKLWHTGAVTDLKLNDPKLWWPHNYGDPNLYNLTAELYFDGNLIDTYKTRFGIRTVKLDRSSTTNKKGEGEFCFIVNGKRIFAMGTNWVPVDAIHSRDEERLPNILPMLDDLGCNIVRCWGGNVYENDIFYNYCDEHGIMVWQDFAMACGIYPMNERFKKLIQDEVYSVVTRLRNHPSIVLWAGDNECDCVFLWNKQRLNPNEYKVTREYIPEALRNIDISRPYLPSSPYIDEKAFLSGAPTSEDHLWGPRDYFKGDYYLNTVCHFASETGYHGCPSPDSLKKFISPDHLWPCLGDREWLIHASTTDGREDHPYGYRIKLMWDQVQTLFGKGNAATADLENFSLASQISQAEAKKFFIERFRVSKWRRTGIIWWNLIDGWPQISDAVVDYYGTKKLAYEYIKTSQQPLCLMFDEPKNDLLTLYAVNDTRENKDISFTVEDDEGNIIASGSSLSESDKSIPLLSIPATEEKRYYIIRWSDGKSEGKNHYFANIKDISLEYYKTLLNKLKR